MRDKGFTDHGDYWQRVIDIADLNQLVASLRPKMPGFYLDVSMRFIGWRDILMVRLAPEHPDNPTVDYMEVMLRGK